MAYLLQQARRVAFDSNKSPERPAAPRIQRIQRSAPLSRFIEALEKDGCVIVSDFTDESTLRQADEEIRPWLEHEDDGAVVGGRCCSIYYPLGISSISDLSCFQHYRARLEQSPG